MGLLGRGGMGRVWLAEDLRLGRRVALKEASADGAIAVRLEREARVTAGLDHPGIVAVHDAGRTSEGRPFYTMQVLQGRSLDQVLAERPLLSQRLSLMRSFQAVCEAMAYAHDRGVVHRDLKPANVLLGDFGQTRVADWGLAGRVEESPEPGVEGERAEAGLTGAGQILGTPAYMSPEQARGERADRRSDVWGLGAMLYEVLAGAPPLGEGDSRELLERARQGRVRPLSELAPEAPSELVAIATRALSPAPEQRYADAAGLAADVGAWLDGRRVGAHEYSARELLLRFWRAYRLPLSVGALGLGLLGAVLILGNLRLRVEAERARAAEQDTRRALAQSDRNLALALLQQAQQAVEQGALAEADLLSAAALRLGEVAEARGIQAALALEPRPRLISRAPLPNCERVALIGAEDLLCLREGRLERLQAGQPRWSTPSAAQRIWVSEGGVVVQEAEGGAALDLDSGARSPGLLRIQEGATAMVYPAEDMVDGSPAWLYDICGSRGLAAMDALRLEGPDIVLCHGGRAGAAERGRLVERTVQTGVLDPYLLRLHHLRRSPRGFVVADVRGNIFSVDLSTGATVQRLQDRPEGLRQLKVEPQSGRVLELPERGRVQVREPQSLQLLARLPGREVQDAIFNGPDEVIVASAEGLTRWALPAPLPPAAFADEEGVSAMAFSPDGQTLWTGHPGHHLRGWSLSTGQGLRVELDSGIVKGLDVDEERLVAVVTGSPGQPRPYVLHQYSLPDLVRRPPPPDPWLDAVAAELGWPRSPGDPTHTSRRVLLLRGGWMLLLPYGRALLVSPWDGARALNLAGRDQEWIDVGPGPGGGSAVVTSSTGSVALVEAGDPPTLRPLPLRSDGPVALVSAGGALQAVVVSGLRGLSSWDVEGSLRWRNEEAAQQPRELAVSPDGRYIAAGFQDHTARLYSAESGALVAVLRGHRERVSAVAFHPHLPLLATGSWDATARLWSLAELELSPAEVEARAQAVWGMGLEEALR